MGRRLRDDDDINVTATSVATAETETEIDRWPRRKRSKGKPDEVQLEPLDSVLSRRKRKERVMQGGRAVGGASTNVHIST